MSNLDALRQVLDLGGPVIAVLFVISVLTLGVILYKFWQFSASGVGQHRQLSQAITAWEAGDRHMARERLAKSSSYLAPLLRSAMADPALPGLDARLDAEAGFALTRLERGFRFLDTVAQLAPLLGLFGTVLGMINAFQSLEEAGAAVDPSLLAGGIWVALLTTAAGLAVAMPTSMVLAWFESRVATERAFADKAIQTILVPVETGAATADEPYAPAMPSYA
jgi:biopolymer transport protein ExbB